MASNTEEINIKVKSDIGDVSKDASNAAGEFKILGVSLNGVKAAFSSAAVTAKGMFASIKAGLISTGIGAFLVIIGSLVSYFTNTKRGADKLQRVMAALGAVVDVLTDAFSNLGGIILDTFQDPMPALKSFGNGLIKFLRDPTGATRDMFIKAAIAAHDFKTELIEETAAMVALKKRTQELRDADMAFMVQKAKTRQEIERARLIAEDETKSATERLENLKKALDLEQKTTNRELQLAKERMLIQQQEMALSENLVEDEQKLAELKTAIIEKETASIKMRRRVVTEVNALQREIATEEKARAKVDAEAAKVKLQRLQDETDTELQLRIDKEKVKIETKKNEDAILLALQNENTLAVIEDLKARALKELEIQEATAIASAEMMENSEAVKAEIRKKFALKRDKIDQKSSKDEVKWSEMSSEEKVGIASSTAGSMAKILGEESAAGKAFAITQATIDTFQGANAAYSSMAKIPYVGPVLGAIAAAAAIASGIANVKAIASASPSGGGGGGGGSAAGAASSQPPTPQMMSGAFDLEGGIEPEATRAYVVTDEMSNSQNQLANIRRRATI